MTRLLFTQTKEYPTFSFWARVNAFQYLLFIIIQMSWRGWYQQGGSKHQMSLTQFVGQPLPGGPISGTGVDEVGQFTFQGQFHPSKPVVRFRKQYTGKHAIYYQGSVIPNGMEGFWGFAQGGKDGAFKMWRE